jgi:hypothetical protein
VRPVKIAIGGDYALNNRLAVRAALWRQDHADEGLSAIAAVFREADIAVLNFEGSMRSADAVAPAHAPGKVIVEAPELAALVAGELGVDAVSLANNHAFDLGSSNLELLPRHGLAFFGGGPTAQSAARPLILEIAGTRTALIGWVDRRSIVGVWADGNSPGANACTPDELVAAVRESRRRAEVVIVVPHWGRDFILYPSPAMRGLARQLVDAGADAVVGTHSHILGCMERHHERPILYSTGNLLMDDVEDSGKGLRAFFPASTSAVAVLDLSSGRVDLRLHALKFSRGAVRPGAREEAMAIIERNSRRLSRPDYDAWYAAHERSMMRWGIRWRLNWRGLVERPGPTARRLARRVAGLFTGGSPGRASGV